MSSAGEGTGQTLPQACVMTGALMAEWWKGAAPLLAADFQLRWDHVRLNVYPEVELSEDGTTAIGCVLGAVFHHMAVADGITVDRIEELRFTAATDVLNDVGRLREILATFAFPPGLEDLTAPTTCLVQRDGAFAAAICEVSEAVLAEHAVDCMRAAETTHRGTTGRQEYTLDHRRTAIARTYLNSAPASQDPPEA